MITSNQLLNELQIPQPPPDNITPPQVATNIFAGIVIQVYQAIYGPDKTGTSSQPYVYRSPANLPLPATLPGLMMKPGMTEAQTIAALAANDESEFVPAVEDAMITAMEAYRALCSSGDLKAIHAAVDTVNALHLLDKAQVIQPDSDLTLLQDGPGALCQFAQQCGPDGTYFTNLPDPRTDQIMAAALAGTGRADMQPVMGA